MKIRLTIFFVKLLGLGWGVFGLAWLFLAKSHPDYGYLYASGGLGFAMVLLILAFFLRRGKYWAWQASLYLVGLSVLLTFFDEMGVLDIAFLALAVATFIVLAISRKAFRNYSPAEGEGEDEDES